MFDGKCRLFDNDVAIEIEKKGFPLSHLTEGHPLSLTRGGLYGRSPARLTGAAAVCTLVPTCCCCTPLRH